jgi:hypothetical protein
MVIYELPTSWAKYKNIGGVQVNVGTFTDFLALFDLQTAGDRFIEEMSCLLPRIVESSGAKHTRRVGRARLIYDEKGDIFRALEEVPKEVVECPNRGLATYI